MIGKIERERQIMSEKEIDRETEKQTDRQRFRVGDRERERENGDGQREGYNMQSGNIINSTEHFPYHISVIHIIIE